MTQNRDFEQNIRESFKNVKDDMINLKLEFHDLQAQLSSAVNLVEELRKQHTQDVLKIAKLKQQKKTVVKKVVKKVVKRRKADPIVAAKTGKAHRKACPFAKNIKRSEKVVFKTKAQAFKKGYKACKCLQ